MYKFLYLVIIGFMLSINLNGQSLYGDYTVSNKQVVFDEDFNDNRNGWQLNNCGHQNEISNGYFYYGTLESGACGNSVIYDFNENRDFEIETRYKILKSVKPTNYHYFYWGRHETILKRYAFPINTNKKFNINKYEDKSFFRYKTDTYTPLIKLNDFNKLTIRKVSDKYYFFINETLVHSMNFVPFFGNKFGFWATSGGEMQIDYLKISYLNKTPKPIADNYPPKIEITYPNVTRGFKPVAQDKKVTITGIAKDASGIFEVLVNGEEAYVDANGSFSKTVLLAVGDNTFTVTATDIKQNTARQQFTIERKSAQPQEVVVNTPPVTAKIQTGNYYALIIGVKDYMDPAITDLDHPMDDALSLVKVLIENYTFDINNVKVLNNPTKDKVTQALDHYFETLTENDNLLVFYAGHGYWDDRFEQGYWLTADANKQNRGTWLSNSTIRDYMRAIPAKHNLLITDACFGGGIFKSRDAFGNASIAINELHKLPSRKAMTSGALKEVPDKSVFIEYMIKRLEQNTDKYLSAEQLFASFKIAVINNSSNGQVPQFGEVKETGDEGGDFIFIRK